MTGYYDAVLGLIPLAFAGVSGALTFAGMSSTIAVTIAAVIAVGFMGHAMFVRAPTVETPQVEQTPRTDVHPVNAD